MSDTKELIKVTQEKLPSSQISLEIEISPERSRHAYEKVINQAMRSAQIPGFRKGKVPRQVVLQRLGTTQLKAAALEELVQKVLEAAIEQEEIDLLGNLQLQSSFDDLVAQFQPGEPISFTATGDVPPEVKLNPYQNLQVSVEAIKYDPAKVDAALEEHRSAQATLVPVEGRSAQQNDVAVVDFAGHFVSDDPDAETAEPEIIEGTQVNDFQLELTEGQFLPGLVEGVIGMTADTTKDISITFPEDYMQEELAGRSTIFSVTLKEIKAKELPDLDDDFAQDVSEFDTLVELRQFLEEQYQQEAKDNTKATVESALVDALLAELDVELPETLVKEEVNFLVKDAAARLQSQGFDPNKLITKETLPQLQERFQPDAVTRVKRTLALAEVAQRESIQVEPATLEERVQVVTQELGDHKIDKARLREVLEEELLHAEVIQWLKDHAQIEWVESKDRGDEAEAESDTQAQPLLVAEPEPPELEDAPGSNKKSKKTTTKDQTATKATPKTKTKKASAKSKTAPKSEDAQEAEVQDVDAT